MYRDDGIKCKANGKEKKKPELLAPGGSYEKCRIAFLYGADAVYVGAKQYSLRSFARNLNDEEIAAVSFLSRKLGKKVYVAVNIFAREGDIEALPDFLQYLEEIRVGGIIASDPGVILLANKWAPKIPLHLSTQANTTNALSVAFWEELGVKRINLARELSMQEIVRIRRKTSAELEVFIHGAMCVSYSGRCLLSAALNRRSANLGSCTQPCRWSYRLVEEKRPNQYFPIAEDSRGSYIFNSKDLCLIEELGELMELGLDAFKIEGRMKGALYLAQVVRTYRSAIDRYWQNPGSYQVDRKWTEDLDRISHRPYTKGFLAGGSPDLDQGIATSTAYHQTHTLAGIVREPPAAFWDQSLSHACTRRESVCIEVRSRISKGTELAFLYPDGQTRMHRLDHFQDLKGNVLQVAHPNSWIEISLPFDVFPLQIISTVRN